jgi:hypothetical protein
MEAQKYISELHAEHNEWNSKLSFYKEELLSFRHRLEEVAKANNVKEIAARVEHFQNQFIRQDEVADELRHAIKQHEAILAQQIEANPVASDHRHTADHELLRDQVITFDKIYTELKHEFTQFLSKSL